MLCSALIPSPPPFSSCFTRPTKSTISYPTWRRLKPRKHAPEKPLSMLIEPKEISDSKPDLPWKFNPSIPCFASEEFSVRSLKVAHKLRCLVSEFKLLPEPIERVKRLLHYAALLPLFEDSGRVDENRVTGCTTQVWLEVGMEADRFMRFRVDSDSEITKGFCSCLVWLLDGATPEEVMAVRTDDMVDINVGLPGRARSRVNTWHNVLFSMQKRTKDLVERKDSRPPSEALGSAMGSHAGAQETYF